MPRKVITVAGLTLQFDADQITSGSKRQQLEAAIEAINLTLQREPYGLGAQLFYYQEDTPDIEVSSVEDGAEEQATQTYYVYQCVICGHCVETTSEITPPVATCLFSRDMTRVHYVKPPTHVWSHPRKLRPGERLIKD